MKGSCEWQKHSFKKLKERLCGMKNLLTNRKVQWTYLVNTPRSGYSKGVVKKCGMFHLLALPSSILFLYLKKLPSSGWPLVTSLANAMDRGSLFLKSSNKIPGLEFTGPTWARWPALLKSLRPKRWNMLIARLRERAHLGANICACWEGGWVTAPSWAPWTEWVMSSLPKKEKSAKVKRRRSRLWRITTFQGT